MKFNLRHLSTFIFASMLAIAAKAQQPLGLMIGDLNTPYSVNMNPANVASQFRNRAYVNWWGSTLDVQSNFANDNGWKRNPSKLKINQNWTPKTADQNWSMNYLNETYGPSLFVMADANLGFGLGVKGVSGFNFSGVSPNLGNVLKSGTAAWSNLANQTVSQITPFAFNTEKYQEWYMSFGSYAGDADSRKGIRAFKWGVTAKMLIGMGAAHLSASELDMKYDGNNKFIINDLLANYSYTDQTSVMNTTTRPMGLKFDLMNGFGAGADIGFMYEYRPGLGFTYNGISGCARELNRTYRWKFGASLTDIGFISYGGSSYSITAKNVNYSAAEITSIDQVYGVNSDGINRFDNMATMASTLGSDPKSSFVTYTPMALNMQWDYRFIKWHLGAYWIHDLKPVDMPGLRRSSTFSVVPRFQKERFEYGFPVSVINNYSDLNVGAYVRVGPFILGSNNLAGLGNYLRNTGTQGASFYFGIRSKIGDCSKEIIYDDIDQAPPDTTVFLDEVIEPPVKNTDTVIIRDTIIKRDTIVKTEIKTVVKRDTVIITKNVNTNTTNPAVTQALADCQKREADLKNRLTAIEAREAAANNKAKNCETELVKFKAEAEKWKGDSGKKGIEIEALKAEATKCKEELDRLKAENVRITAEVERLRVLAEEKRTVDNTTVLNPTNGSSKKCDSLLRVEVLKNQRLTVELTDAKNTNADCKLKLADAIVKSKTCETDLANEKLKSNGLAVELANAKKQIETLLADKKRLEELLKGTSSGEDCTPYKNKIAELEKLLAAERLKTAQLTADLLNCNKSLETLKIQLAAEQAKVAAEQAKVVALEVKLKAAEAKAADCDTKKAAIMIELEAAKKKVSELEEKIKSNTSNSGSDCSKTRDSLAQALLDLGIAKNAYDALMAEYQDCLKTSKSYKDKLKACEDKLAAGSSDGSALEALKAEIAKLKITITELNGEVAAGKKSLDVCQESLAEKDALIKSLQDQLKGKNADITTLQSQLRTAQTQLNDVKARLAKCEEEKSAAGSSNAPTGTGTSGGVSPGGIAPGGGL